MCRGAGNAASAFGAALQVDSARTGATESLQHPAARGGNDADGGGDRSEDVEGARAGSEEDRETGSGNGGSAQQGGGVESGDSMRAELLALQLVECANEMEDHLNVQVVQPIERVLASRSDIKAAIRERSLAADSLATAHSDYAKSVARYQSSSGETVNGGPPLEVVQAGDKVVWASDAFAEAHGRAEEALTELLEERGRCLRQAAASLKAAQAGFFVRASRCVSSSVAWESMDDAASRTVQDIKHPVQSSGEDARSTPVPSNKARPADAAIERGHEGAEEDGADEQTTRNAVDAGGLEDRNSAKGKWRKGGDRDGPRSDSSKRRRSSGWFKRLASSFQTSRPRSASEELQERLPSPLHEQLCDNENSGGDDEGHRAFGSTAPAAMSSVASSRGRSLFGGDGAWKEKAPPPNGRGIELEEWTSAASSRTAEASEPSTERVRRAAGGGSHAGLTRVDGAQVPTETEEDGSDYETGSNTTEGFGSDDAGDLWDGRRSTLMGPLGRTSFMPIDNGMKGETAQAGEGVGNGNEVGGEGDGDGGKAANPLSAREKVGGGDISRGAQGGEVEKEEVEALIDLEKSMEGAITQPCFSIAKNPDDRHGDCGDHVDNESKEDQEGRGVTGSAVGTAKAADVNSPAPTRRISYFGNVSPSTAPPSVLPASPESEDKGGEGKGSPLPPVVVGGGQQTPSPFSKLGSSPAISDGSSSKESPRAWRLSWWARASDRHPPPPPSGAAANTEEAGGTIGTSFATALAAASAGGEEAVGTRSAGGGFAPSFNAGDAPAVVDGRDRTSSPEEVAAAGAGAAKAGAANAERRENKRSSRRRRQKPWLSRDKLADAQARPLEAASEYLNVAGLARADLVCRAWRETLGGEEGRRRWMSCVRLADGVPDKWRAKFYLHILYDQPSWVQKAHGSSATKRPCPGVYRECLAKAEDDQEETKAAKEMQSLSEEEERDGRSSPMVRVKCDHLQGSAAPNPQTGSTEYDDTQTPTPKCHKWLEEIETDVLRTCPDDKSAVKDAADEFDAAISQKTGAKVGGDGAFNSHLGGNSARVRFSIIDTSFGDSSGGAVVEMSPVVAAHETASTEGGLVPSLAGTPNNSEAEMRSGEGDGGESGNKIASTGGGTRDKLRRVLRAFAVYNRRVSYCQGMNFVALALLEACGGDDENAFWILAGMCENLELEGLWCQGLERLDLCFFSLDRLLRRHCPTLRQHLSDEGVELSMFTSRWFVTLFTSTDVFGRGTSRKILDMFMVEGWPLLFKMSLGVLLEMRPLLEPADMEGILKVTKFPRAHLFGLRRDGSGRHIAGASFEEATQGSLCESIRAGQMVEHALLLHISEETLEQHRQEYRLQKHAEPGSD
eukprot:g2125.t1